MKRRPSPNPAWPITIGVLYGHPLHVGGVENHLLALFRLADPRRFRWVLFAPVSHDFAVKARAFGIEIVPWEQSATFDLPAAWRLLRLLQTHPVDLLHIHNPYSAILGRVVARWAGLPVIVTVHLPSYALYRDLSIRSRFRRRVYIALEGILNRWLTDALIFVSGQALEEARTLGIVPPRRVQVIENGIDLCAFQNPPPAGLRRELGAAADALIIISVGRLTRQKGFDVLLEAFRRLDARPRPLNLWLVGDGELRRELEEQAAALNLGDCVRFLGYRADVPALLQCSDIFAIASRYEGMPLAILEAQAAGLPCVVSAVGENAHQVDNGSNGLVVPPEDSAALAASLQQLLDDPALRQRMSAAARQKAAGFSDQRLAARLEETYSEVLKLSP